jgi:sulfur-oxidizing protein SoxZ
MTEPSRIRAIAAGDKTTVRILMKHEMESGQRKDTAGRTVPAWHIQDVTVRHNGKVVFSAACGPSVSKDPYLQLTLRGAKAGDRIAVAWKDNRGATRSDEAVVA